MRASVPHTIIYTELQAMILWVAEITSESLTHNGVSASPPTGLLTYLKEIKGSESETKKIEALHTGLKRSGEVFLKSSDKQAGYSQLHQLIKSYSQYVRSLAPVNLENPIEPTTKSTLISMDALMAELQKDMNRLERQDIKICLAQISIDQETGRTDLIEMAIKEMVRDFDDIYQISKEEFILGLKDAVLHDIYRVMERLRDQIENEEHDLTVSIGIIEPIAGEDIKDVLKNLKIATQDAIQQGGNAVMKHSEKSLLVRLAETVNTKT